MAHSTGNLTALVAENIELARKNIELAQANERLATENKELRDELSKAKKPARRKAAAGA